MEIDVPEDQRHDFIERLAEWAETPTNAEAPLEILGERLCEKLSQIGRTVERVEKELKGLRPIASDVTKTWFLMTEKCK